MMGVQMGMGFLICITSVVLVLLAWDYVGISRMEAKSKQQTL